MVYSKITTKLMEIGKNNGSYGIEILDTISASGEYEEKSFGTSNDLLWVLFSDRNSYGNKWVGKFEIGIEPMFRKAQYCMEDRNAIILSGGIIYILDTCTRSVVFKSAHDTITDFMYLTNKSLLIFTDGLYLYQFDFDSMNITWQSDRISWDGISFTDYTNGNIIGILNDLSQNGTEFNFNVDTRELTTEYNIIPI